MGKPWMMLTNLKKLFYFPIASYFRFFAAIQLKIWKPRIFVITGSSGKTTLLHLLESQIGARAEYSHQANSSFGIPFDILDLKRKTLTLDEWPILFLQAPFKAFQKIHNKNLYIVEADCDRLGEGKFLASLLKPEMTIWLSSTKTHSVNFPPPAEESIAEEFGYFLENTTKKIIINGDSQLIKDQSKRTKADIEFIKKSDLKEYQVNIHSSRFKLENKTYELEYPMPKETFYQIGAMLKIMEYLSLPTDQTFSKLQLPPGRNSVFRGIRNTTILDSSYNADLGSMTVMLDTFDQISGKDKWVVLGDMVEQGREENSEHEKLAPVINSSNFQGVVLVGPRLQKYTLPLLKQSDVESFITPREALNYLKLNIRGGELMLFKGARFLEGIIEHLLQNKGDISKLCRREKIWQQRRKKWGL